MEIKHFFLWFFTSKDILDESPLVCLYCRLWVLFVALASVFCITTKNTSRLPLQTV